MVHCSRYPLPPAIKQDPSSASSSSISVSGSVRLEIRQLARSQQEGRRVTTTVAEGEGGERSDGDDGSDGGEGEGRRRSDRIGDTVAGVR